VIADLMVHGALMLYAIGFMMGLATIFTWVERKQSAVMSDRIGANRCYIRVPFTNVKFVAMGLFHAMADGGKLLLKENFTPRAYDRLCYDLAPWLAAVPVLVVFAIVPFGGTLTLDGRSYALQVARLDAGILVALAVLGIGSLGTILAGWSSNNKFSLMGAARAASQMISYEVAMGFAVLSMVVTYGTLDLGEMVRWQSQSAWGIFVQPLAFLLFVTTCIAENKRVPFDLPECESELVAGYFTEYTSMKMGLFMLSEFLGIVLVSALTVTLFLGGYDMPGLGRAGLPAWAEAALQVGIFSLKTFLVGCFMIQVRWTLPRFRYDQLMAFGWKFLLPLAALNLCATVLIHGLAAS
jgi:NADH-quinone oxidoreductase subunit H